MIKTISRFHVRSVEETPRFDPATWRLRVDGLVDNPLALSYRELLELESKEQVTDFHGYEEWSVKDVKWKGVRLKTIFGIARPRPEAAFITFHSASGIYSDSLSIKEALEPYVVLAYMQNDKPLPAKHGRPLRLVVPRMFGYKSVKWVNRITLTAVQEVGYRERLGYKADGVSVRD